MENKVLTKKTVAHALKNVSKTYQLNYHELLSIFFKLLYLQRRANLCLDDDIFVLSYSDFKKLIHSFVLNLKLYFGEDIKYQKVLNIFLRHLDTLTIENKTLIVFKDLQIDSNKITKTYLLSQISDFIAKSNKVNRYAIYTLKRLVTYYKSKKIPIEIFLILISNIQFIYFRNTSLFEEGTIAFKEYYLEKAVLCKVLIFPGGTFNVFSSVDILSEIPSKNDTYFNTMIYNKEVTFSLPFLIDFFGHDFWYKSFFGDEPSENSFKFKLGNFTK